MRDGVEKNDIVWYGDMREGRTKKEGKPPSKCGTTRGTKRLVLKIFWIRSRIYRGMLSITTLQSAILSFHDQALTALYPISSSPYLPKIPHSDTDDRLGGRKLRLVLQHKLHPLSGFNLDFPSHLPTLLQNRSRPPPLIRPFSSGAGTRLHGTALAFQASRLENLDSQTLFLTYRDLIEYSTLNGAVGFGVGDCASPRVDATTFFGEDASLRPLDNWFGIRHVNAGVDAQAEVKVIACAAAWQIGVAEEGAI